MVLFKLLPFFGPPLGFSRRKRAEGLLVVVPIVFPVLLFVVYLISR